MSKSKGSFCLFHHGKQVGDLSVAVDAKRIGPDLGDFHVDVNVADEVRPERCVFGDICCMLHATLCCDLYGQNRFAVCRHIKVYDLWH